MSTQFFNSIGNPGFVSLWNKYRPAILQMMVAADDGPQEYKFFKHEFKAVNSKEKTYSFVLEAHQGKSNNLKISNLAKDLLFVLVNSPKANELMETNTYEFTLDKQFVLHIKKINLVNEEGDSASSDSQHAE